MSSDGSVAAWTALHTTGAPDGTPMSSTAGAAAAGDHMIPSARFHHTATAFDGKPVTFTDKRLSYMVITDLALLKVHGNCIVGRSVRTCFMLLQVACVCWCFTAPTRPPTDTAVCISRLQCNHPSIAGIPVCTCDW